MEENGSTMELMLTETQIQEIYIKHIVKSSEYLEQYSDINTLGIPLTEWKFKDCCRIFTVLDFKKWTCKYNCSTGNKFFYTDKNDPELEHINYTNMYFSDYETNKNADLHTITCDSVGNDFDFALINHTLEHLCNPLLCLKNLFSILKPGGFLFAAVPTLSIAHNTPIHFCGITPSGLAVLCKMAGFDIKEVGYWGNKHYITMMYDNIYWPDIYDVMNASTVHVINDPELPVQTWILVQKPEN